MPITQIIIKNYKSLKNLTLRMKRFMAFVGPNNAGKSNLFDAFRFVSDFVKKQEIQSAVQERGGFEHLVFNGDMGQPISFELHGKLQVNDRNGATNILPNLEVTAWETA